MLLLQTEGRRVLSAGRARGDHYKASSFYLFYLDIYFTYLFIESVKAVETTKQGTAYTIELECRALRCA